MLKGTPLDTKPNKLSIKEKDAVKLKECCDGCGKPISGGESGNITNWLFRGRYCQCKSEATAKAARAAAEASKDASEKASKDASVHAVSSGQDSALSDPDEGNGKEPGDPPARATSADLEATDAIASGIAEISRKKIDDAHAKTLEILPAALLAQQDPIKLIGKIVGHNYQIVEYLGKGHTGHVFKVQRQGLDGAFVLKILEPSLSFTKRHVHTFLKEAELARELDHHNVIALYDAGTTDDEVPYIVTDFFEGKSLTEILDEEELLDESKALDLFIQICEGLSHAHSCGLIHRDVKPGNVRIKEETSGNMTVKVLDCGVSKVLPNHGRETRYSTQQGFEYGDATYMSPEQCTGSSIDARSDIYSLGCLMYQCLTGKPVFSSDQPHMLVYKHVRTIPRRIEKRFPELKLSRDLEELVMRCLEKDPGNRYQSVADLKDDLEAIKAGRPVRRSFKGRLSQRGKAILPAIPDSVFAPVFSFWYGLTSNQRLWMLGGVFLIIGFASFFAMVELTKVSPWSTTGTTRQQEKLAALLTTVEDNLSTTVQSNPRLHEIFTQIKKELLATRQAILENPIVYTAAVQDTMIEALSERLAVFEAQMDAPPEIESEDNEIVDKKRQTIIFRAPAGTSQADTIKLAVSNHADLSNADLRGVNLAGLTFNKIKLANADLNNTYLRGCHFKECDMSGADFTLCDMRHAQIVDCNLSGAKFNQALLERATVISSVLDNAKIEFADIREMDILGGTCANATFNADNMEGFSVLPQPGSVNAWSLSDKMQRDFEALYDINYAAELITTPGGMIANQVLEVPLLSKSDEHVTIKSFKAAEAKSIATQTTALSNELLKLIREARLLARLQASSKPGLSAVGLIESANAIAKKYDTLTKKYPGLNEQLKKLSSK